MKQFLKPTISKIVAAKLLGLLLLFADALTAGRLLGSLQLAHVALLVAAAYVISCFVVHVHEKGLFKKP